MRLASLTTLAVGGPAEWVVSVRDREQLHSVLRWARDGQHPLLVLGGGSNVLVSDRGLRGGVVRLSEDTIEATPEGSTTRVRAAAGVSWDRLVEWTVERGLAGLECLSGIPGAVGAAPIQNIGAYGQEVGEVLDAVWVSPTDGGEPRRIPASECGLRYRWSRFKGEWRGQYVVTSIELSLRPGPPGALRYGELARRLTPGPASLAAVRAEVLRIRRSKSMVIDSQDPNRRSAGSFFTNPIIAKDALQGVQRRLAARGYDPDSLPVYPADGGLKLSAAWLIERAGFPRGYGTGPAGLSTRHTLAIVNRGDATASDVVALASELRSGVQNAFGVVLWPEPVFLGFDRSVEELLAPAAI